MRTDGLLSQEIALYATDDVPYHVLTKTDFPKTKTTTICLVPTLKFNMTMNKKNKINFQYNGNFQEAFDSYLNSGDLQVSMYITNSKNGKSEYFKRQAFSNCMKRFSKSNMYDRKNILSLCGPFRNCEDLVDDRFSTVFISEEETPHNFYKVVDYVGKIVRTVINKKLQKLKVPMPNTETIDLSRVRKNKEESKEFRKILEAVSIANIPKDGVFVDSEIDARFSVNRKYHKILSKN